MVTEDLALRIAASIGLDVAALRRITLYFPLTHRNAGPGIAAASPCGRLDHLKLGPAGQASVRTSDRSPDHRVWKIPSSSTRRYVWAPKKSRWPWIRAAGSRSEARAS